ncbi:hypothetical protein MHBO_000193 [Bonamia ostreae]|uniref:tryptophan--tRNA ligase n=1 Tax=Bonamia ostreae TaxID=126728 RepID=A0ABV2AEV3_9EUKA
MTQYKTQLKQEANFGLLCYPLLQAADILAYNPTHVPVGPDQKQHVELTRSIARNANSVLTNRNLKPFFNVPEAIISKVRIMSLTNGVKKMSKSDENTNSRINLDDSETDICSKIENSLNLARENNNFKQVFQNLFQIVEFFETLVFVYSAKTNLSKFCNTLNRPF